MTDDVNDLRDAQQVMDRFMTALLATYQPDDYFGTRADIVSAYILATFEFDRSTVAKALSRFLEGRVDETDPSRLPTAPELAQECRQIGYLVEAEGFDMGAAVSSRVAQNVDDIDRLSNIAADQELTTALVAHVPNVVPLRARPGATSAPDPKGAA